MRSEGVDEIAFLQNLHTPIVRAMAIGLRKDSNSSNLSAGSERIEWIKVKLPPLRLAVPFL